jgi:hypothetical protein
VSAGSLGGRIRLSSSSETTDTSKLCQGSDPWPDLGISDNSGLSWLFKVGQISPHRAFPSHLGRSTKPVGRHHECLTHQGLSASTHPTWLVHSQVKAAQSKAEGKVLSPLNFRVLGVTMCLCMCVVWAEGPPHSGVFVWCHISLCIFPEHVYTCVQVHMYQTEPASVSGQLLGK